MAAEIREHLFVEAPAAPPEPLPVRGLFGRMREAARRIARKVGGLFGRRKVAEHPFAEKTSSER